MIEHIGRFRGQMLLVAAHPRQCRFHRFFPEFFGALLHPLREKLGGVGSPAVALSLAGRDGGVKLVELVIAHGPGLSMRGGYSPSWASISPGFAPSALS